MNMSTVTPVLRIFDEGKACEFYLNFLGFTVDWKHRYRDGYPLYMGISSGECRIHLTEHHGDATPGSAVRILTHMFAPTIKNYSIRTMATPSPA